MGYEIDFLAVGENSDSGDAIALRFGDLRRGGIHQTVVVIDGGFKENGGNLVQHIQRYYKTNTVDLVISTHPDRDHVSGLREVVEELKVNKLWMHRPWENTDGMAALFSDGRVTDSSLGDRLEDSLNSAKELEEKALEEGIDIEQPFHGCSFEVVSGVGLIVLSPSHNFYRDFIHKMLEEYYRSQKAETTIRRALRRGADTINRVREEFGVETLTDEGETSPLNNTSTIILFTNGNGKYALFTSDAGIPALNLATGVLEESQISPQDLDLVQVPHHGSKRNVTPEILDRLLGPRLDRQRHLRTAVVSAAEDGEPKHPAKKVTNAFRRRGAPVYSTQGVNLCHHHNAPNRTGWSSANPLPFYEEVEE